jgi:hypothetical protein
MVKLVVLIGVDCKDGGVFDVDSEVGGVIGVICEDGFCF